MLKTILEWTANNWQLVILGCSVLASVANLVTKHWGEQSPGLKKIMLFILDLLSVVNSQGSPSHGVKLPLATSPLSPKAQRKADLKAEVKVIKEI